MAQFCSFAILLGKLKHKNNNINFLVAKTCTTIKHCNPATPSISYVINPDGSEGLAPFVVSCNMTDKNGVGLTVVSHASANRMLVDCYEPAGCLSGSIVTSVQQLVKLADISAHCEHFIQYECPDSQLLNGPGSIGYMHDWWVLRDGKAMTYWGGGIILLTSINA